MVCQFRVQPLQPLHPKQNLRFLGPAFFLVAMAHTFKHPTFMLYIPLKTLETKKLKATTASRQKAEKKNTHTHTLERLSRWWFQILFFHPYLGKMNPFCRSYFSDGLVQPPTSCGIWIAFLFQSRVFDNSCNPLSHWYLPVLGLNTVVLLQNTSCIFMWYWPLLTGWVRFFFHQQLLVSQKDWLETLGLLFLEGILTTLNRDSSPFHCRNLYQWTRSLIVFGEMKKRFYPSQKCLRNSSFIFAQHSRKMYCHSYCLSLLYYLLIVLFVSIIICYFYLLLSFI